MTGSTNADLVARARSGEPGGLVLVADEQTGGRGRQGRSWQSPAGAGLTASVLLRPDVPPEWLGWVPLLGGVAVAEALRRASQVDTALKWPNDVLIGGLKVAGLLAELVPAGAVGGPPGVVLGIGVNLTQADGELPVPTATSLALAGAAVTDRDAVLAAVLDALAGWYQAWVAAGGHAIRCGVAAVYRDACVTVGQEVRVQLPHGGEVTGRCEGVHDDGRLLVRNGVDQVALSAGDVVHVRGG